jgi:hypothetical protein
VVPTTHSRETSHRQCLCVGEEMAVLSPFFFGTDIKKVRSNLSGGGFETSSRHVLLGSVNGVNYIVNKNYLPLKNCPHI